MIVPGLQGSVIYEQDFEGFGPGAEWSTTNRSSTPAGCSWCTWFLGEFGNQSVSLRLSDLPDHTYVTVDFDLYVIRSWDGNVTYVGGPDIFGIRDTTAALNYRTTFSNNYMYGSQFTQAYPDPYPDGAFASQTGAFAKQVLGYTFDNYGYGVLPEDAIYHLSFTFPHADSSMGLMFYAQNLSSLTDESWGLDNVAVTTGTPEPASIMFITAGLILVIAARSKRAAILLRLPRRF